LTSIIGREKSRKKRNEVEGKDLERKLEET